jgi:hypothetical protein
MLLNGSWYAYVFVFPVILAVATCGLVYWEISQLSYRRFHYVFDAILAATLLAVFFLYQVQPYVAQKFTEWKARGGTSNMADEISDDESLPSPHA